MNGNGKLLAEGRAYGSRYRVAICDDVLIIEREDDDGSPVDWMALDADEAEPIGLALVLGARMLRDAKEAKGDE